MSTHKAAPHVPAMRRRPAFPGSCHDTWCDYVVSMGGDWGNRPQYLQRGVTKRRVIASVAFVVVLTDPALADNEALFACEDDSFATVNSYEARISVKGSEDFAITLPLAISGNHGVVWSPHGETSVDKNDAPRVPYVVQTFHNGETFPTDTPSDTSFDFGSGEVQCRLLR